MMEKTFFTKPYACNPQVHPESGNLPQIKHPLAQKNTHNPILATKPHQVHMLSTMPRVITGLYQALLRDIHYQNRSLNTSHHIIAPTAFFLFSH